MITEATKKMDDISVRNVLKHIYPIRKYSAVINIINITEDLEGSTELTDAIENIIAEYVTTKHRLPSQNDIDIAIFTYVVPNVINNKCKIIMLDTTNPDMYFISGLLKFYNCLDVYHEATTSDIIDTLNDSEIDEFSKLGEIVSIFQQEVHQYDIYDIVDIIPNSTIEEYKKRTENVMELMDDPSERLSDLYSRLLDIDLRSVSTKLLGYIIKYDNYDISLSGCLTYIDAVISNTPNITPIDIARELIVAIIVTGIDNEELDNIVESQYSEYGSKSIIDYINKKLVNHDFV